MGATMTFDPSQPFEVESAPVAFDPSKPFEVEKRPLTLPPKRQSMLRGGTRAVLQGATLGFSDELGSAAAALAAKGAQGLGLIEGDKSLKEIYSEMQGQVHNEQEQFKDENPVLATGLEIAGGVAPALAAAPLAVAGKTLKAKSALGALTAGTGGAIYGAGSSEQGKRTEGAIKGGVTGAAIGAALPLAGAGLSATAGGVKNMWNSLRAGSPQKADAIIRKLAKDAGLSTDDVIRKLDDLGEGATLADVDETFLGQAHAALGKSSGLKGEVSEALYKRQAGQQADILKTFSDELAGTGADNVDDALASLAKSRTSKASPLYKKAFDSDFPEDLSKNPIFEKMEVREALRAGEKIAKAEVDRVPGVLRPVERLHYAKKALWDKAQGLRKDQPEYARAIDGQRKELDKVLNSIPEYKQARNIWADSMDIESAADYGRGIMKNNIGARQFNQGLKEMSESELEMARLSALDEIVKKIEAKPEGGSITSMLKGTTLKKKVRQLFGSDEAFEDFTKKVAKWDNFAKTKNKITGGSKTEPMLAEDLKLDKMVESVKNVLPNVLNKVGAKISKSTAEDINKEMARKLLTPISKQSARNALTGEVKDKVSKQISNRMVLPATTTVEAAR